ncbi:carbon-monoxide dehydrogenase medium subunit [Tistlia consotensis]|uniref:Carbon-monoxide dehydrogenase medium subunit n=1 Tax=Tistlia consotensis USBA 355 TaxID=560819 RepID=A0A1Y6CMI7_9PROT|nr:xanthine dehydrogenase family protein subunit M [Tistlia consotensis]SMF77831.1 carbon-monoxide dehydrogenase medium subunit [Tistlia consotensis USBA 355]SNS20400.1 carbon-monoxide dehydrogenase medium subunit [Tistlia consotensis]
MYDFTYHRPSSLEEAAKLLAGAEDGKILAGGHTLLPTLKQRLAQPSDLIDLSGIKELKGISEAGGAVVVGAMTPHGDVADSSVVKARIPALAHLASDIGDAQVRHRGTIGGSIANADPAADYPAAVVGLGATVKTNKREIAGGDFFKGLFETALDENELVVSVSFPVPEKAGYAKFANPASRYPIVGVMVAKTAGGVRVAVTGAGASAFRWTEAEQALSANWSADAIKNLTHGPDGLNSDIHASAEYRAHLIGVMARRALAAAG